MTWEWFWAMIAESYLPLDRMEWAMKHFPLVELIGMMKAKPTMSVFDFAKAFGGSGKGEGKNNEGIKTHTSIRSFRKSIS